MNLPIGGSTGSEDCCRGDHVRGITSPFVSHSTGSLHRSGLVYVGVSLFEGTLFWMEGDQEEADHLSN